MFGLFGKKTHDVRLTDAELKKATEGMSRRERKDFERRQREAEADRDWDALMTSALFFEDEDD